MFKSKKEFSKIKSSEKGFTLMELVIVIIILGILSLVAAQSFIGSADRQKGISTIAEMQALKKAIVGDDDAIQNGIRTDFGYVGDVGGMPSSLSELVSSTATGWNGPYIDINFDSNEYLTDAWGVSYGANTTGTFVAYTGGLIIGTSSGGGLSVQLASSVLALTSNTVSVVISDRDGSSLSAGDNVNISLVITLQGSGTTINGTVNADGTSSITGVPIGNHILRGTHTSLSGETATKNISVTPGSALVVDIIFTDLPEEQ